MDKTLKNYLDAEGVQYELLRHAPTQTAMETAEATHIEGKLLAKSVIVRLDGVLAMVVVPATHYVDLAKLEILTGADMVDLADEHDFRDRFPDCEPGAMPVFANLYGMPLYVADALKEDEEIVFNAGTHSEAVKIRFEDFVRLAKPLVRDLSTPRGVVQQ